jgi:hypothetical protein
MLAKYLREDNGNRYFGKGTTKLALEAHSTRLNAEKQRIKQPIRLLTYQIPSKVDVTQPKRAAPKM